MSVGIRWGMHWIELIITIGLSLIKLFYVASHNSNHIINEVKKKVLSINIRSFIKFNVLLIVINLYYEITI
jgi:hypothetical protein